MLLVSHAGLADLVFESATPPTVFGNLGGLILDDSYIGTRFELTDPTAVSAVFAHVQQFGGTLDNQRLFAAIVPLSSATALPTSSDIETVAVAHALFQASVTSAVVRVELPVTLDTGFYGLVLGAGSAFGAIPAGAFGYGSIPYTAPFVPDTGSRDYPETSYFSRTLSGTWRDSRLTDMYIAVEGTVVPLPPALAMLVGGLAMLSFVRRLRYPIR